MANQELIAEFQSELGPDWKKFAVDVAIYAALLASITFLLLPVIWTISTSFKPIGEVFEYPPRFIPRDPTLENYKAQLSPLLGTLFFNSFLVGAVSALVSTVVGAMTAYAICRFKFAGNDWIMLFFMATLAFPIPMIMISTYIMFAKFGLLNTYWAMILGHVVITLPVTVWLLRNFFDQLPGEVEEAALIDGAGPWYTFFRIVLPMAKPAMSAAGIFVFITSWNELLFGLTFVSETAMRPIPAGVILLFLQEYEGEWAQMMALAVIVSLPILLLFVFFQNAFLRGVTGGAVKG
ncbi:carbohydrate ABC transporter permease [Ruegeria hyattellae]|uniref:carbohydrate ABC transporter permease n=1 Tax=Ruegeria hyattellae TaxID=3233337 RepID=UPI00355B7D64